MCSSFNFMTSYVVIIKCEYTVYDLICKSLRPDKKDNHSYFLIYNIST